MKPSFSLLTVATLVMSASQLDKIQIQEDASLADLSTSNQETDEHSNSCACASCCAGRSNPTSIE